jgi:tetratricopeptide (TPR) repeat protein
MRMIVSTAALSALALAAAAGAAEPKAITFTTRSDEARAQAREAIRRVESFAPPAQIQEAAKKAVAADPEFAWAHYLVAVSTFPAAEAKPHHEKALELVKKASPGEQKYLEAVALNRAQKPAEALAAFEALRTDYPDERMVHMMVGQLSIGQGKLDQARASFEKAIAMDGSTARAYALAGNAYILGGDYDKARQSLQTALSKKAPGAAPGGVYFPLALSFVYEGNPDGALTALRTFLDEYKKTGADAQFPEVFIWNAMARINLENSRLEEAMRCYQKGYESVPASTLSETEKKVWLGRLHHGTGRTLARMGKQKEAWAEADTLKKMIDEGGEEGKQYVPAYHYLAGYLKLEAGEYPAAIEHLKQAHNDDPFHQLLLARAYEKSGDKVNAKKVYQEITNFKTNNLERALSFPEAKKKASAL